MFGVFHLPTPQFLQGNPRAGGALGTLGIGAASGLVVGPCTGPGLAAVAALIANAAAREGFGGGLIVGILAMLAYSLGQGSLIILCGTFSGLLATLPKSGRWLNLVKKGFAGLMLLGGLVFVIAAGQSGDLPLLAQVLATRTGGPPEPRRERDAQAAADVPEPLLKPPLELPPAPESYEGLGRLAPRWTATTLQGDPMSFEDLRGRAGVFMVFWANWCAICHEEVPELNALARDLDGRNVVLLGMGLRENPRTAAQFLDAAQPVYPLLLDEDGSVAQRFNVTGLPTYVAIDRGGVVRDYGAGLPKNLAEVALALEQAGEPNE
jgi:peroxiredoxin